MHDPTDHASIIDPRFASRVGRQIQGEQIHLAPTAFDEEMGVVNARNTAFEGGVFVVSVSIVLRKANYPADFEFDEELAAAGEFTNAGGVASSRRTGACSPNRFGSRKAFSTPILT
jgi:hypothetical protein